jgi:hypothetical protein
MGRRALAMVFVLGCGGSGGGGSVPADAAPDARADAAIDAPGDKDNDGVLDGVDVCPDVADPAQVDLDGDHVGWMCDPEESTTASTVGQTGISTHAHGNTVVTDLRFACSSTCKAVVIAVGPEGFQRITSESTATADDWIDSGLHSLPFVSQHGWVVAAPAGLVRRTGTLDLATGAFTARSTARPNYFTITSRGEAIAIPAAQTAMGETYQVLLEPQANGELAEIGVTSASLATQPFDMAPVRASPGAMPVLSVPIWNGSTQSLARWVPGTASWTVLQAGGAPLAGLSTLVERGDGARSVYCAIRAGVGYVAIVDNAGDVTGPLPTTDCNFIGVASSGGALFFTGVEGSAYVYNGAVHSLTGPMPDLVAMRAVTGDVPVVLFTHQTGTDVWAVDTGGNPVLLATALTEVDASSSGTTAHVVGRRGGSLVLVRFRSGAPSVEIAIPAATGTASVLTTFEGAALVTTSSLGWVLPSQATIVASIDLSDLHGAVRGNLTVVSAARDPALHPGTVPAVYAYDEVAGAPRLTMISPEHSGQLVRALDAPDAPQSPWFVYYTPSACTLGRLGVVGGVPALSASTACTNGMSVDVQGVTSTGKLVVEELGAKGVIYLLDATVTKVVDAEDFVNGGVLREEGTNHVYGWIGVDHQGAGYACLASHPDRCWRAPSSTGTYATGHWGENGAPDSMTIVTHTMSGSAFTLSYVRSIGTGTRPQPL